MSKGKLFLVPTYLSEANNVSFIAPSVIETLQHTRYFLVENVRTARRFISSLKAGIAIDDLHFSVLDKKASRDVMHQLFGPIRSGHDIALMSEAGVPCLADPGHLAVSFAHRTSTHVVPLPGASSVPMALMASGFNGQQFTFHGYLPIDKRDRTKRIKELEKLSSTGYTQLFIEAPYRNHQLLDDIMRICRPDTYLGIAADISGEKEFILSQPISKWKTLDIQVHKTPTIFSFAGASVFAH